MDKIWSRHHSDSSHSSGEADVNQLRKTLAATAMYLILRTDVTIARVRMTDRLQRTSLI